ncbi:hypothetical protein B296_00055951 [Ensete ventricosum]|uniref:Nodulin-like domain-containing protein n=1 Tax=Ensete ventricosum TaxID=4639 RepID=A0A426XTK7_ENSVE|nr:hypothetical protein B296_00055951 [Ensete ventricosum]
MRHATLELASSLNAGVSRKPHPHEYTPLSSLPARKRSFHDHDFFSSSYFSLGWLSLIGIICLQTINGANTDIPVYSSELKKISQAGINFLAFASDAGKLFGWFSGFLFLDKARFTYQHMVVPAALAGNGICWIDIACYLICIRSFASDTCVADSTSYGGLSAKVYTVLASAVLHRKSEQHYLLLNAVEKLPMSLLVSESTLKSCRCD